MAACSGLCALGFYCPAGSVAANAVPCPAGSFANVTGLTSVTCSGLCSIGFWCDVVRVCTAPTAARARAALCVRVF